MSKVLTSFLVGIGYDTKGLEAGERKIAGSMQGIKGGALGISAALVGAFSVGAASIAATANSVDQLALKTQNLRTSQNTVYNFANALRLMGGDAESAVFALTRFEDIQNNRNIKGELPEIAPLAMSGIQVQSLYDTKTGEEFAMELARQLPQLNEAQRAVAQDTLGIDDATFRLLASGVGNLNEAMQTAQGLTGNVEQLNEDSRKLLESTARLGLAVDGIQNELAGKFLESLIGASEAANNFLKEYRPQISGAIDVLADNPEATATILGSSVAAVIGAALSKVGLTTIGGALSKAGPVGVVAGSAAMAAPYVDTALDPLFFPDGRAPTSSFGGSGRVIRDDLTASDAMTAGDGAAMAEERRAQADALAGALSRSPVKVVNEMTIQLDGQALEAKITEVNERAAFDTINDVKSTTER